MQVATINDIDYIAPLLLAMYMEVDSVDTKCELELFKQLTRETLLSSIVIFDSRGFFIMKNETPIVKKTTIWNGVSVYVKPEFRHSSALQDYYKYMFEHFQGTIMGFTEVNSKHNKVLLKRHKLLGYVYGLNR